MSIVAHTPSFKITACQFVKPFKRWKCIDQGKDSVTLLSSEGATPVTLRGAYASAWIAQWAECQSASDPTGSQ